MLRGTVSAAAERAVLPSRQIRHAERAHASTPTNGRKHETGQGCSTSRRGSSTVRVHVTAASMGREMRSECAPARRLPRHGGPAPRQGPPPGRECGAPPPAPAPSAPPGEAPDVVRGAQRARFTGGEFNGIVLVVNGAAFPPPPGPTGAPPGQVLVRNCLHPCGLTQNVAWIHGKKARFPEADPWHIPSIVYRIMIGHVDPKP